MTGGAVPNTSTWDRSGARSSPKASRPRMRTLISDAVVMATISATESGNRRVAASRTSATNANLVGGSGGLKVRMHEQNER